MHTRTHARTSSARSAAEIIWLPPEPCVERGPHRIKRCADRSRTDAMIYVARAAAAAAAAAYTWLTLPLPASCARNI